MQACLAFLGFTIDTASFVCFRVEMVAGGSIDRRESPSGLPPLGVIHPLPFPSIRLRLLSASPLFAAFRQEAGCPLDLWPPSPTAGSSGKTRSSRSRWTNRSLLSVASRPPFPPTQTLSIRPPSPKLRIASQSSAFDPTSITSLVALLLPSIPNLSYSSSTHRPYFFRFPTTVRLPKSSLSPRYVSIISFSFLETATLVTTKRQPMKCVNPNWLA